MRRTVVRTVVVLVALAALATFADRTARVIDLTAEQANSLTAQTRAVVDRVDDDVRITAAIARDDPARIDAVTRLDRYERLDRRIATRVLDPADAPGEISRLGIDPLLGGAAIAMGGEVEVVASASEQDLTAGLARLVRGDDVTVCSTTGHGEREPGAGTDQLGDLAATLEAEGFRIRPLDLLVEEAVDETCSIVLVADPTAPLGRDAERALSSWVADDGRLLLLADPASTLDHEALLEPLGLTLERGIVFEGDPEAVIGGDVTAPIIRTYSSGHPIVRRLAPTYLPGAQGIEVDEAAQVDGLTISQLATTSPASYLETEPAEAAFDPDADVAGPITVAVAADRSSTRDGAIRRTRVVVIADVDIASNAFVGEAANRELLRRSFSWLADDEAVAAIAANLPADRELRLTDARVTYARLLAAVVVPLLFLLAGGLVWAVRRTR